jgi:phosphopantothenoylcysteine decarboxylase/phosphopantothenate--cysteine ligase
VVPVGSALDLSEATRVHAAEADVVVMAAAVADFRMQEVAPRKLKKEALGETPRLDLRRNPDVLADLGRARALPGARRPILVGFAAETHDLVREARAKLTTKGCDLIVANDVSDKESGFEVDTNRVTVLGPGDAIVELPLASKDEVAHQVWDRVITAAAS